MAFVLVYEVLNQSVQKSAWKHGRIQLNDELLAVDDVKIIDKIPSLVHFADADIFTTIS